MVRVTKIDISPLKRKGSACLRHVEIYGQSNDTKLLHFGINL